MMHFRNNRLPAARPKTPADILAKSDEPSKVRILAIGSRHSGCARVGRPVQ
jgi:hypothetical protein